MADSPEAVKKAQKLYLLIGAILFVFTVVTLMVATVPALDVGQHGFDKADMVLGLFIATIKAGLVAAIFKIGFTMNFNIFPGKFLPNPFDALQGNWRNSYAG